MAPNIFTQKRFESVDFTFSGISPNYTDIPHFKGRLRDANGGKSGSLLSPDLIAMIPGPSSFAPLGIGLAGLGFALRKKSQYTYLIEWLVRKALEVAIS